jgi:hypothetical protein
MATPYRIKRSAVPGKIPQVTDLQTGELALNTYDAELYTLRDRFSATGIATEVVRVAAGATVRNVIYVTTDGNDNNTGLKLGDAKRTIKAACGIATAGSVIKVSAGTYLENNPVKIPEQVSIVGDNLREVSVTPQNQGDLFHVSPGNYITELSFVGPSNTGAIFAFDPDEVKYFAQSPYIQNCTNFIPRSIGLKVDGNDALGPIKSMVLDSYTQYNEAGIGASITNEGYAQLVSLFTICDETAVFTGSGGACDLTNSNSSFGDYGLVSDGVGPLKFNGSLVSAASVNESVFTINVGVSTLGIVTASFDHVTGILSATTTSAHGFGVGMGITISGFEFTCPSGPGIVTYPSGNKGYIFETITVAPGRYVDSYNLIQANRQEIIDDSYAAIGAAYPLFTQPDPDKCKRDIGYIVDAVSTDVRDYTSKNSIDATNAYFNDSTGLLISNGLLGEVPQTIVGFTSARDLMKLAVTNNLTVKNLSVQADPVTGFNTDPASCADVRSFIDNLVGIITTTLDAGNLNTTPLPSVSAASTEFSVKVGTSTLPHDYLRGGQVKINVVRPFDGQVIYFGDLYKSVGKIVVSSAGTGYLSTPTVTIGDPDTDWGITAQGAVELQGGSVSNVVLISSGRGYTSPPTVTFSAPDSGINTARGFVELVPSYFAIESSTELTSSGICTVTLTENIPFAVGSGTTIPFYKQSRLLASGHSFEYIGSGTTIASALPQQGGVVIQDNEVVMKNGGLVVYTSTDQAGNFRIGEGVVINQLTGTISGNFYSKSLFANVTPLILALGGN